MTLLIIKGLKTKRGVGKYDYNSLANAPEKLSEFENDLQIGAENVDETIATKEYVDILMTVDDTTEV